MAPAPDPDTELGRRITETAQSPTRPLPFGEVMGRGIRLRRRRYVLTAGGLTAVVTVAMALVILPMQTRPGLEVATGPQTAGTAQESPWVEVVRGTSDVDPAALDDWASVAERTIEGSWSPDVEATAHTVLTSATPTVVSVNRDVVLLGGRGGLIRIAEDAASGVDSGLMQVVDVAPLPEGGFLVLGSATTGPRVLMLDQTGGRVFDMHPGGEETIGMSIETTLSDDPQTFLVRSHDSSGTETVQRARLLDDEGMLERELTWEPHEVPPPSADFVTEARQPDEPAVISNRGMGGDAAVRIAPDFRQVLLMVDDAATPGLRSVFATHRVDRVGDPDTRGGLPVVVLSPGAIHVGRFHPSLSAAVDQRHVAETPGGEVWVLTATLDGYEATLLHPVG